MATIEIRKDKRGQFRFAIKSRNGETIATGESYTQKAKAMATARSLAAQLAKASIVDLTAPATTASTKANGKRAPADKPRGKTRAAGKSRGRKASTTTAKPAAKTTANRSSTTKAARPSAAPSRAKPLPAKAAAASAKTTAAGTTPVRSRGGSRPASRDRDELPMRKAEPIRTPASVARANAIVSRGDETRPTQPDDDFDTVAQAEGNDVVRADQLGDGEGITNAGTRDARPAGPDTGGGDDSGADPEDDVD